MDDITSNLDKAFESLQNMDPDELEELLNQALNNIKKHFHNKDDDDNNNNTEGDA